MNLSRFESLRDLMDMPATITAFTVSLPAFWLIQKKSHPLLYILLFSFVLVSVLVKYVATIERAKSDIYNATGCVTGLQNYRYLFLSLLLFSRIVLGVLMGYVTYIVINRF